MRQPLMLLPTAFSAATDAWNATNRLTELFLAETMDTSLSIDPAQAAAVEVTGAGFEWVTAALPSSSNDKSKKAASRKGTPKQSLEADRVHLSAETFRIRNLNLSVPRGSLVAIVGPVGSGKSSLLQGLIGEMKRTAGSVTFSGPVAYCPQSAWIQNGWFRPCLSEKRRTAYPPHPLPRPCQRPSATTSSSASPSIQSATGRLSSGAVSSATLRCSRPVTRPRSASEAST
jgi:hypothetical protein